MANTLDARTVESELQPEVSLSRDLGLLDITMIGVGAMIGAGVFVLTGIAAGEAGPALILAFALNGVIALIIGSAYAELGSCFPEAGGGYLWVRQGMSEVFGFLSGWMSWFAHAVACSLYALGFGAFAAELIRIGVDPLPIPYEFLLVTFGVLMAAFFVYVNFRGSSETGLVGNIVTSIKILILLVLAGFGLYKILTIPDVLARYQPFLPEGMQGVFIAMGLTFIAFEGYEIVAQSGEEVKDPGRNIPRAIFLSIAIAVVIYLLIAFVALGAITAPSGMAVYQYLGTLGELGMVEAAGQIMPYGKFILLLAGLASTMSALNATIYSSSRVSFAMGRDGNLPAIFGRIHPVTHTPYVAVFISGALIVAMAILLPIEDVAASADIMFLLLFMMVCISAITLRKRRPDLPRRFMMPFFPYLAWVGIAACIALSVTLFQLSPVAWYTTIIWLLFGLILYYLVFVRQQEKMAERREPILLEEVVAVKGYGVMVPVRGLQQAHDLGRLGSILAAIHDGELVALHVVRVPRALTIGEGRVFLRESRPVLEAAIAEGRIYDVPVRTMLRLGRNVAHTIMSTARQRNTSLLLLGWPGYSTSHNVAFGSVIDLVAANPPCDVAVVRFRRPWDVPKRILIPTRGRGPNALMAFEMARELARFYARPENGGHDIQISALHVVTPNQRAHELSDFRDQARELADELGFDVTVTEVEAATPVEGIAMASRSVDLVILGASAQGILEQRLFGNIPEQAMHRSTATTIMCKRYHGTMASWLRHLLLPAPLEVETPAGDAGQVGNNPERDRDRDFEAAGQEGENGPSH